MPGRVVLTGPAALVVNPVTNLIYVANGTDGTVTVIDAANGDAASTVTADAAGAAELALPIQVVVR